MTRTTRTWEISESVIGGAIEVHREIGPGLLESIYEECLARELGLRGHDVERQRRVPIVYKGHELEHAYRCDLVVDGLLLVEIKAVDALHPIHDAQMLTYLRLTRLDVGLLFNFNTRVLRNGMRRLVRKGASIGHSPDWHEGGSRVQTPASTDQKAP